MRLIPPLLLCLLTLMQSAGITAQNQVCNNAAALCARPYNNVTYLGAHDSPFIRNSANSFSVAGNQFYTTVQQLESGVRLVSAQVHPVAGDDGLTQYHLCHSLCQLFDAGTLIDWFSGIKGWLDENPDEVITILLVNAANLNASTLGQIYQQAGLDTYSYSPASVTQIPTQWPTLTEMITQNRRVVNFIADIDTSSTAPYLLNEFTFVFENNYNNFLPSDFSCQPDRPETLMGNTQGALSVGYLPLMNHFRYDNLSGISIPSVSSVNVTNAPSGGAGNLGVSANTCSALYGRSPTFILVDFSNVGPAIETVDRLNGVSGQTRGRLVLPDSVSGAMADPSPTSTESGSVATTGSVSTTSMSGSSTRVSVASSSTVSMSASTSASRSSSVSSSGGVRAHGSLIGIPRFLLNTAPQIVWILMML